MPVTPASKLPTGFLPPQCHDLNAAAHIPASSRRMTKSFVLYFMLPPYLGGRRGPLLSVNWSILTRTGGVSNVCTSSHKDGGTYCIVFSNLTRRVHYELR